jgi:hypothetical protein
MPDKSLKVTASSSAGLAHALAQYVENYSDYEGKTVTISALIEANTTTKGIRLRGAGVVGSKRIYGTGLYYETITIPSGLSVLSFGIQFWDKSADNGNYFIIKGMKLELGEISTLANDAPPKIATDLAECQRYLIRLASESIRASSMGTNTIQFFVPLPVEMRVAPSLASGTVQVMNLAGAAQEGFTFVYGARSNGLRVVASKTSHGMTDAVLNLDGALFSAEL